MQDNPNTENPPLDAEDWQIAFEVYAGHPIDAFSLAHKLIAVQEFLQGERKRIPEAIAALDQAVDTLYEHTEFRRVSHELYRAAVEGRITTEQEAAIRELRISI